MSGPLTGTTVIELAGVGPGPFAGMMLADMGAEVISVDRPGRNLGTTLGHSILTRGRRRIAVDLKRPEGVEVVLRLIDRADAVFEGFRPGVAERLGIGPDICHARNPRLVYGRMTGWGQDGPLATAAGHDINYIALTGALHAIGRRDSGPVPPLNLVGDFGGGGMLLAFGMVCALLHAQRTGQGQVVDAAMVDGAATLMAMFYGLKAQGLFDDRRGTHLLDSGAHFYDVYETADGRWISLGPIEPQFYATLCDLMELDDDLRASHGDLERWPELKERLAEVVRSKTRDEWDEVLAGSDACYAPVLGLDEAPQHPHMRARRTFVDVDGAPQPAPAPRFSATAPGVPPPAPAPGSDTRQVLAEAGFTKDEVDALATSGVVATAQ